MKRKIRKHILTIMATFLFAGLILDPATLSVMAEEADASAQIELTRQESEALAGKVSYARTSVHDPSIVPDGNGNYYIFGSHMGVSKTSDLRNWTSVTGESVTSNLFGNADGEIVSYTKAFSDNAYKGTVTVLDANGNPQKAYFGSYDVAAWISGNTVAGNMWAPDVIAYNGLSVLIDYNYVAVWSVISGTAGAEFGSLIAVPWLLPVVRLCAYTALVNMNLAVFNLLPIPPLDGYHVVNDLIFRGRFELSEKAFRICMLVVLVLAWQGMLGNIISAVVYPLQQMLLFPIRLIWG